MRTPLSPAPEDRRDMAAAALYLQIKRLRTLLGSRALQSRAPALTGPIQERVAAIEASAFAASDVPSADEDRKALQSLVRGLDGREPELEAVLSSVAHLYGLLLASENDEVLKTQPERWGGDRAKPLPPTQEVQTARGLALRFAATHASLEAHLRSVISSAPVSAADADARRDEVLSCTILRSVAARARLVRRALRLVLRKDPSELLLAAMAYQRYVSATENTYGTTWVCHAEATFLTGHIDLVRDAATQVIEALSDVGLVFDRPAPPPAPLDRSIERELCELALAHADLKESLVQQAAESRLLAPVLDALKAGTPQIDTALLATLDDPTPRYGPAHALGRRWSDFGGMMARVPLETLPVERRDEILEYAATVAVRARKLLAASE